MNSLTKVLVIILVFRGGLCFFSSDLLSRLTTEVSLGIDSLNWRFSNVVDLLNVTEDGKLDLNDLTKKLNLKVNLTTMFRPLNITVLDDGLLNLESLLPNFSITNALNMDSILSSLNVKPPNDVLNWKSLIHKLTNFNLTEVVNSLSVKRTEDGVLDFVGFGRKLRLTIETFKVTTEDGYILQIFHIPGNGSPVLCSHGITDSSDGFIIRGNTSLAYILAQNGYDVWVMNYRGNRYSRSHKTLNPDTDKVYWEFSMQEKGYYDLAATIDFVLETTGQDQLSVIGHSEGTATVFVLTSTSPEYNEKIKLFIALSPVCYLSDSGFAVTAAVRLGPILNKWFQAAGIQELVGYRSDGRKLIEHLCSQGETGYNLCNNVFLGAVSGYGPDNLEPDFWYTVLGHYPAGASRKEVNHYFQIGNSDAFIHYDYGSKNIEIYGTELPPRYNLQNIRCKVSLVGSKNDKILGLRAVERLCNELPNVIDHYVVEYELFNHVDFLIGRNAHIYVYPHVIELLNKYSYY